MPGTIWSGRWGEFKRAVFVEQCFRIRTPFCPKCKRGTRYVYSLPTDGQHFACRVCLGLKYKSQYAKALANNERRIAAVDAKLDHWEKTFAAQRRARCEVVNPVEQPKMAMK